MPAIFHGTPIDENVLVLPRRSGNTRRAHQTPNGEMRRRGGSFRFGLVNDRGNWAEKSTANSFSPPPWRERKALAGGQPFVRGFDGGQLPDEAGVFEKFKSHGGKSQRGQGEVMLDVGRLRFFAAQEFAAGGQIEKKLADFDAWRQARCRRL